MQKLCLLFLAFIITNSNLYSQQEVYINSKTELHILFIGNSLTYTNNLPKLVKDSAFQKGINIKTKMIAFPNYGLEDHWVDGKIQELISSKKFDFVVIQQGPSSQNEGRKMLLEYGKKISSLCQLNHVQLCFFMVWPSLNYYNTFEGVIKNYEEAASINNSILLPVGRIWKAYFDSTNSFEYYSSDGFHPSKVGSQIAAKVIVEYLFKK